MASGTFVLSVETSVGNTRPRTSELLLDSSGKILGLPPIEGWSLIGGAVMLLAFFLYWTLLRRSRRRGISEDIFDTSGRPAR
jgi:hypothetical protein